MREFAKSTIGSFLGAGLSAMEQMLTPFVDARDLRATVESVRAATDVLQRGVVDLAFSFFTYETRD